jgi:hypothetical protein
MATIEKRNLSRKEIVLESKRGRDVEEIVDGEKKMVTGKDIPVISITMQELTCAEAMDADDFSLAQSKTGRPSIQRIFKTYGIFSVVKIKDKHAPHGESVSPKSDELEYEKFLNRISSAHADRLGMEYRIFANEIAEEHDPKNSPNDKP